MYAKSTGFNNQQAASLRSVFWRDRCRTVKALLLRRILCSFQALFGGSPILTSLVPDVLHFTMNFAKEVLVGLVFHDKQSTLISDIPVDGPPDKVKMSRLEIRHSAVVGSMTVLICEMRLAGNPPCCACWRTVSSSGAMYTQ